MDTVIIGGRGYIGSALQAHITADIIDLDFPETWENKYWDVENYRTIILLAGHSSMPMGRDDPDGAWRNNVINFKKLLDSLRRDQKLIYASSASVYNNIPDSPNEECKTVDLMNMYDFTKFSIDQLAKIYGKHTYGLRFVTINGFSPVLRVDLMLNKMVDSVKREGKVSIKNKDLKRPILGMQDACRAIKAIVDSDADNRGIYNLCSLNGYTVGEFANAVTQKFGGEVVDLGNEPHYVYGADTTKFEQTYDFKFTETLDSILESLKKQPNEEVVRIA